MHRSSLVVLTAVLGLPLAAAFAAAPAAPAAFAESKVAEGTIKSADDKGMTFVLTGADKKDTTVKVTKDTKYMLDGKESTMAAALKAGNHAKVTHTDGTATKVEATSSTPKKPH